MTSIVSFRVVRAGCGLFGAAATRGRGDRPDVRDVLLGSCLGARHEYQRADHGSRRQGGYPAIEEARRRAGGATERERGYIEALAKRYSSNPEAERTSLDRVYADAIRDVARRFPDDVDVATLFAQSLMSIQDMLTCAPHVLMLDTCQK